MGLLRLILALSVLFAHTYTFFGYRLLGAQLAVDTFFVISGFYMALILHTKYIGKNGSYSLFITNRFLRIFPLYWAVLFLTVCFALAKYIFAPASENAVKGFIDAYSASPDFIWHTTDWVLRNSTLLISSDYFQNTTNEPGHLLLLQAWTLQVELLFYLLAPFLVKLNLRLLLVLVIIFSAITFGHVIPQVQATNWLTPAFLYSFVFFLLGMLSYQLYVKITMKTSFKRFALPISIFFLLFLIAFGYLATSSTAQLVKNFSILYFFLAAVCIPFIFLLSQNNKFDARIGLLSYPVYIAHFFVFKLISNSPLGMLNQSLLALITIFVTLGFAYLLVKFIEEPIDRFRAGRLKTKKI